MRWLGLLKPFGFNTRQWWECVPRALSVGTVRGRAGGNEQGLEPPPGLASAQVLGAKKSFGYSG